MKITAQTISNRVVFSREPLRREAASLVYDEFCNPAGDGNVGVVEVVDGELDLCNHPEAEVLSPCECMQLRSGMLWQQSLTGVETNEARHSRQFRETRPWSSGGSSKRHAVPELSETPPMPKGQVLPRRTVEGVR